MICLQVALLALVPLHAGADYPTLDGLQNGDDGALTCDDGSCPTGEDGSADTSTIEHEAVDYETVVVGKRRRPPGTYSTFDSAEIGVVGARDLPEVFAHEPSVEVLRHPKLGSSVQVRGFDERSVLLTIEGIPVREVYEGRFDSAAIPASLLGTITLERGVTSPLHGPGSAGAVLSASVPATCESLVDASFYAGRPFEGKLLLLGGTAGSCVEASDFTLRLGAGYEHSEGYPLSRAYERDDKNDQFHEDGGIRDGSDHQRAFLSLLARWSKERNRSLTLFLGGVHAPRGIPPFESAGHLRLWRFSSYDTVVAGLSGVYSPHGTHTPLAWGFRETRGQLYVHLHRNELRDYEDLSYTRLTRNPLAWFVASAFSNDTYGAAWQGTWALFKGNRLDATLRYGLDVHRQREMPVPHDDLDPEWDDWKRYSSHNWTAAIEDTQTLGPWRVSGGLSATGVSLLAREIQGTSYPVTRRIIFAPEYRLLVDRILLEGLSVMFAGGHKVRHPTLKELFANHLGGNRDLQSERALMFETGFDAKDILNGMLHASARLYANSIDNLIELYRDGYDNAGRAIMAGTEIELRYHPLRYLNLVAGHRFLHARDLDRDRVLDYRTPHRLLGEARLSFRGGLTAAMRVTYNSGQRAHYLNPRIGDWVVENLSDHTLLGAHLRWERMLRDSTTIYVFANAFNLLDANHYAGSFEPRSGRDLTFGLGIRPRL